MDENVKIYDFSDAFKIDNVEVDHSCDSNHDDFPREAISAESMQRSDIDVSIL